MAGNLMLILMCILSSSSWYYNLSVEAYSTGAPVDTNLDICNTMTPNHQAEATTAHSPYHISVESLQYTPGQPLGSKYTWVLMSGIIKLNKENIFMYQTLFLFPDNFHQSTGILALPPPPPPLIVLPKNQGYFPPSIFNPVSSLDLNFKIYQFKA